MKKVFMIHGFQGSPNGGWRPWLMGELDKKDIYACALAMPTPDTPKVSEWVNEIVRNVDANANDEIYLVGHSLGTPAILHYLESDKAKKISGALLVSGPVRKLGVEKIDDFMGNFEWEKIKENCKNFVVIHGDNDDRVPPENADILSRTLNCKLIVVKNGGHLNSRSGWTSLLQALEALNKMFEE